MDFVQATLDGNRLALARLLTEVENGSETGAKALDQLFAHTGKAHLIGVTGAPGTGKSSLVNQLALHYRKQNKKVAIVAVDPSSPFTGGAVLGDRVRMRDLSGDTGIFIRSMATRGSLGGLARSTAGMVQVFDAAGFEIVIIETVGAGQAEVDIARLAHSTLVVEAPGLGDEIQAIKAGIMEIADILVINKADRPGVENTERALKNNLELAHPVARIFRHHGENMPLTAKPEPTIQGNTTMWIPPVQRTIATDGTGLPELITCLEKHLLHLKNTGGWEEREKARLLTEFNLQIKEALVSHLHANLPAHLFEETLEQIYSRQNSPREAANILLSHTPFTQ